ncbi:protein phosphatase 2C domain-containing protein [Rothia sp. AR01]|uniref:Protein phosphatase 2C domain-containing protein n=1 Tax=Rothia santali TaxID=2949643 RepID=A0A9X2HGE8_9MICC|nr:protein phosphatase 2C domain-containing protein [Rothia santali]MCP3426889.1 protein phosphatase 2C domain-containing protein [Rothia santali]
MSIAFRYAARSDTGRVRSKNDDSAYTGRYLAVVADGMGGHVGGNVASASTVLDLTPLDRPGYEGTAGTYLADEIQTANIILNQLVRLNPLLAGMGTTCTALLVDGDELELAHIGDSRAYRLRGEDFEQMSTDHTFVQRLVEEGRIRPEDAESHPHKNVIMRVLGDTDASPELELRRVDARVGDRWLLCSDGLPGVVDNRTIEAVLKSTTDLQEICETLVDLTLDRGAPDNVTVAVVEIAAEADVLATPTSKLTAVAAAAGRDGVEPWADTRPQPAAPSASGGTPAGSHAAGGSGRPAPGPATPPRPGTATMPGRTTPPRFATPLPAGPGPAAGPSLTADPRSDAEPDAATPGPAPRPDDVSGSATPRRVAPWRRRLPRDEEDTVRHVIHRGAWRGDSFSDGVLNAMTQRSGIDLEDAEDQEQSSAAVLRNELDARPHLVVGAAEAATHTGAIPTVTDSTLQRRATMTETTKVTVGEDGELPEELLEELEEPQRKQRIGLTLFIWAFIAVLLAGVAWASLAWINTQYYVGESEGYVAVYRGVNQSVGPVHLSSVEERTDTHVSDLPEFSQARVDNGITASSLDDAQRIVSDLSLGAAGGPSAEPVPEGTVSEAPPTTPGGDGS